MSLRRHRGLADATEVLTLVKCVETLPASLSCSTICRDGGSSLELSGAVDQIPKSRELISSMTVSSLSTLKGRHRPCSPCEIMVFLTRQRQGDDLETSDADCCVYLSGYADVQGVN